MIHAKTRDNVNVITEVRIKSLYRLIYELAENFGANENTLDSLKRGILDKKIIKEFTLEYYNNIGEIVGEVEFEIDWEMHKLIASTPDGQSFTFYSDKSFASQVSSWLEDVNYLVNEIKRAKKVSEVNSKYRYIASIENDEILYKDAMKYLGHHLRDTDPKKNHDIKFAKELEFITEKFKELKIRVKY